MNPLDVSSATGGSGCSTSVLKRCLKLENKYSKSVLKGAVPSKYMGRQRLSRAARITKELKIE